jgi:hypothetical protein
MGSIYEIICWTTGLRYIGQTTQTLKRRLQGHKKNRGCSSTEVLKHNNYEISLIEYVNDKTKCLEREHYHIQHNDCVNIHDGSFNVNAYYREYRKTHPTKQNKEYKKEWYGQNKDRILKKQKNKYICQCGSELSINNKSRHEKTKEHINKLSLV